jgi:hypothetical protein
MVVLWGGVVKGNSGRLPSPCGKLRSVAEEYRACVIGAQGALQARRLLPGYTIVAASPRSSRPHVFPAEPSHRSLPYSPFSYSSRSLAALFSCRAHRSLDPSIPAERAIVPFSNNFSFAKNLRVLEHPPCLNSGTGSRDRRCNPMHTPAASSTSISPSQSWRYV